MITTLSRLITKLYQSYCYSQSGLTYAWKTQSAFRIEIVFLIIALPFAIYLSHSPIECILMISSVLLLPILELLNSAIETTLNRISTDYHDLSKYAKDMASAALLLACINIAITWGIILIWHFV